MCNERFKKKRMTVVPKFTFRAVYKQKDKKFNDNDTVRGKRISDFNKNYCLRFIHSGNEFYISLLLFRHWRVISVSRCKVKAGVFEMVAKKIPNG